MEHLANQDDARLGIALSKAEALVLFELLSRFEQEEKLTIADAAEERVLWNICGILESALVEPFEPNYRELLERARATVRDN